jgi:hypothetical protein
VKFAVELENRYRHSSQHCDVSIYLNQLTNYKGIENVKITTKVFSLRFLWSALYIAYIHMKCDESECDSPDDVKIHINFL